jgi:hypothetical protein
MDKRRDAMRAEITFVDGTTIIEECHGFNTWSRDEISLLINEHALPIVRHIYPNVLVRRCVIYNADGSLAYEDTAVNDKYINGYTDENGDRVIASSRLWKPEKIKEYLMRGADK